MGRGFLTPEVKAEAEARLGREITQQELRLMPYLQYCLLNEGHLDPRKVTAEEREILSAWRASGWMEGGASRGSLNVTKDFWDAIHEILWLAYVNYEN